MILPEVPQEVLYLWELYLHVKRASGPLTWQELKAWSDTMSIPVTARDADAIMQLDNVVLRTIRDDDSKVGTGGGFKKDQDGGKGSRRP